MKLPRMIQSMIGRPQTTVTTSLFRLDGMAPTRDWFERDYAQWDKARHADLKGLELSGLFLKPLASKVAAWVLGQPPRWTADTPAGSDALNQWWDDHHAEIVRVYEESAGLGMAYTVINADLSVTLLPPNVVTPMVDPDDYSQITGWRVTEVHPHPTTPGQRMTMIDEYTATERVHIVKRNGAVVSEDHYPNLIGRLPIVPIPNNRGVDEVFGSPEGAATIPLLQRYGEVLESALSGNKNQGRPTPTAEFENVEQLEAFWDWAIENGMVAKQARTNDDGTTETYYEVQFDSDQFLFISGGTFKYAQPGSFANDTATLLGLLFYLFLEHTEIPEFVWGNALESSKASAEAQLPPFVRWIEKKRGAAREWLLEISRIALAYTALWERGIGDVEAVGLMWEELTQQDGALTMSALTWAYAEGLIDRETALKLTPLDVQDIPDVLAAADAERAARRAAATSPNTSPDDLNMQQFRREELRRLEMMNA